MRFRVRKTVKMLFKTLFAPKGSLDPRVQPSGLGRGDVLVDIDSGLHYQVYEVFLSGNGQYVLRLFTLGVDAQEIVPEEVH